MEKIIFKYLEFLLPIHNCVIIPEFGGFIINVESTNLANRGINAPAYHIVFNSEIKHNDGILASYIIKEENLSYNAACIKIKDFAKRIQAELKTSKSVQCGNLGFFTSDEFGNTIFLSNKSAVYPAFFGLDSVGLRQLVEIDRTSITKRRFFSLKYAVGGVAAIAASLFLFVAPSFNIKDSSVTQEAGFLSSIVDTQAHTNVLIEEQNNIVAEDVKLSTRTYYIVVAGEETKTRANRLLGKIKATFPDADIIVTADRYRIYVSSFTDKAQGEAFLETFRKENPKYETAWLFSKRN